MDTPKEIGKREFIQHTSRYLRWVETENQPLVITHHNEPDLILMKIHHKTFEDLKGLATFKIKEDINEPVLKGYDTW
jgi:hypothetical protein